MMANRSQFDGALDMLRLDVDAVGSMAQDTLVGALAALVGDDWLAADRAVAAHGRINDVFVALEERAYALVALQGPVAIDLRFIMSSLQVMADYGRMGNRALGVATSALAEWDREPTILSLLARIGDVVLALLAASRRAWRYQDLSVAGDLRNRDETLEVTSRQLVALLRAQGGPRSPDLILHAQAIGWNLERIADHAVIVSERVRYTLTGDPSALAAEIR